MITVYTPLSKKDAKEILQDNLINFSHEVILNSIITKQNFEKILRVNLEDMINRDPTFYTMGLVLYCVTASDFITAIDFSKFNWVNRIHYISYNTNKEPKIIKIIKDAHKAKPQVNGLL